MLLLGMKTTISLKIVRNVRTLGKRRDVIAVAHNLKIFNYSANCFVGGDRAVT